MLSFMETATGLMVVGPNGKYIRVARSNAAFNSCISVLRTGLPEEQTWAKVNELLENALSPIINWFQDFGLTCQEATVDSRAALAVRSGQTLVHIPLTWQPLLLQALKRGFSPNPVVEIARMYGKDIWSHSSPAYPIGWVMSNELGNSAGFMKVDHLPDTAKRGDVVLSSLAGVPYLVFYECPVISANKLVLGAGKVIRRLDASEDVESLMAEPILCGNQDTYICEEGSENGWQRDLGFDSLANAETNMKDIQMMGSEARIVNKTSGLPVNPLK